jgi:hypothetical protein
LACRHIPVQENFEMTERTYTALIQRNGPWWIGWIEEIPA